MKWKKLGLPALLSVLGTLAGCQTATTIMTPLGAGADGAALARAGRAAFCDVAEPITYADKDTTLTKLQIREHNRVGVELQCPSFLAVLGGLKW